jgi:hypothetical protein
MCDTLWVSLSFVFNDLDEKLLCMVCHLFGAFSARAEEVIVPHLRRSAITLTDLPALPGWATFCRAYGAEKSV